MKWIVIGVICIVVVLLWTLGKFVEKTFAYRPPSPPTPSPSATTGSGAATATTTPPTPPPAPPAPVPVSKTNWLWPVVVGILAIVVVIWVIAPMMTKTTTAPAPKVAAPKKELRKYTKSFPLEFVGGENLVREPDRPDRVGIRKGGYANFRVNLPIVINGNYKIHYHGQRIKEGRDFLEINRGKGNGAPFSIKHGATDFPVRLVFFDDGYDDKMSGEAKYFRSGENYFKLSADEDLLVQLDKPHYVEITYWE